jgi:hypothetical protein
MPKEVLCSFERTKRHYEFEAGFYINIIETETFYTYDDGESIAEHDCVNEVETIDIIYRGFKESHMKLYHLDGTPFKLSEYDYHFHLMDKKYPRRDALNEEIIQVAMRPDRLSKHISFYEDIWEALDNW